MPRNTTSKREAHLLSNIRFMRDGLCKRVERYPEASLTDRQTFHAYISMQQYSKVATIQVNFTNGATFGVGC